MKYIITIPFIISTLYLMLFTNVNLVVADYKMARYETTMARITCYSDKGIMSSGKYVYDGAVATSDRTIKKGTKVRIGTKDYVVEDRTAKWVHEKFGLTVDIWKDNCDGFGRYFKKVIIK